MSASPLMLGIIVHDSTIRPTIFSHSLFPPSETRLDLLEMFH